MDNYSVLMSLYNKERPEYLRESLDSMINQTVKPDEIVIVEDGPLTDELLIVINDYCQKYPDLFNIVINENNIGLGLSLNKGLKACRNELVARMDTDDISKADRCEKQLMRFERDSDLVLLSSTIDEFVDNKENVVSQRKVPLDCDSIYSFSKRRSAFNHPAVMYKKSAVLSVGGYSDLRRNQDVDLFGRMIYRGYKGENIDESLLWFRSSDELANRRKSWLNTKSYISTIYKFKQIGYSSLMDVLIVTFAQIILYLLPARLQKLFYKLFLR